MASYKIKICNSILFLDNNLWESGSEKLFHSQYNQNTNVKGDVKYGIGSIVNNIVVTTYGAMWMLDMSWGLLCKGFDCLTTMPYNTISYKIKWNANCN